MSNDYTAVKNKTSMTFLESIRTCFEKYAVFEGRASRSEFWYFYLFCWCPILILLVFDNDFFSILGTIFFLINFLPQLTVSCRRLHDLNKSAWYLLLSVIPVFGPIMIFFWFANEGTKGKNIFGPSPIK